MQCQFEKIKIKDKVTLTLLIYMPWISEITDAISASSAIGDRRERRGFGGGWMRVRRGARTVAWLTQCRSVCMICMICISCSICMYAVNNLVSEPGVCMQGRPSPAEEQIEGISGQNALHE